MQTLPMTFRLPAGWRMVSQQERGWQCETRGSWGHPILGDSTGWWWLGGNKAAQEVEEASWLIG